MPRLLSYFLLMAVVLLFGGCDKDNAPPEEEMLYGMWVNVNKNDTLYFYKKGIRHIMRSNQSFNSAFYHPHEREFQYKNGKLGLKMGLEYYPVTSFTWKVPGREFEVQAIQFYMFLSSTLAHFTYQKVF